MKVIYLAADVPLTKSFTKNNQEITKTPYPFVWEFSSIEEDVPDLPALERSMRAHAKLGHCLLKGTIARPLVKESRAGTTATNDMTDWAVLDLDGLPPTFTSVDAFLTAIGLGDVSYVVQWSASYGIADKLLRAHVFFMLERAVMAPLLKQWLVHVNHANADLKAAMTLTKTGCSIRWPLDVSACQNDKLIYIAPPVLKNLKDPVVPADRIKFVKKKKDRLAVAGDFSTDKNRELTHKRIAELRSDGGYPKLAFKYKMHGAQEVMIKPGQATVTEIKRDRGFVYFNLNGGDSWAYYHPENNPDLILNFKGEPAYLTKELIPDYWADIVQRASSTGAVEAGGKLHLAFCDRRTAGYWIGTYEPGTDTLDIHPAKNSTQVRDYAKQVGLPIGDFIPVWDLEFDPHSTARVDPHAKVVNTFNPSPYMRAKPTRRTHPPKTIMKIIEHALGNPDQAVVDHFLNWCAFIVQKRDRTRTAWVLHGTEGTGKGILCNNILRPIIGQANTTSRRMEELNEPYNHFMRNSFLVVVDEVQTKALQNERGAMAKLRNFITEKMVAIRQMYANGVEFPNYTNWIFNSNMPDPVAIPKNDRRFNVAKYQPAKLVVAEKEIVAIEKELQHFHDYLFFYPMNEEQAAQVIQTADRNTMISISETSIDTVADNILKGDFEFLIDQLPAGIAATSGDWRQAARVEDYKMILKAWLGRTDPATGVCNIAREELRGLFEFIIGGMPGTPNKFTSLLKHHRIHIGKVWLDNRTVNGLKITWADLPKHPKFLSDLTTPVKVVSIDAAKGKPKKAA